MRTAVGLWIGTGAVALYGLINTDGVLWVLAAWLAVGVVTCAALELDVRRTERRIAAGHPKPWLDTD